jgi:hypothetical protein
MANAKAKKAKNVPTAAADDEGATYTVIKLPKLKFTPFHIWVVGDTPLITHAWSKKAKDEILQKQMRGSGRVAGKAKEAKNPQQEFVDSLYDLGDGTFGFPVTGVKKCFLSPAHKDKGIPRDTVMRSLWLDAPMHRVRPALAGAICDMPLVRIYGGEPEMREDMVKVGVGLNKKASFAYRGQFTVWALRIEGRYDANVIDMDVIAYLVAASGMSAGLGEWRNERHGVFGAFHMASSDEGAMWDSYAAGKGGLPLPEGYKIAAE